MFVTGGRRPSRGPTTSTRDRRLAPADPCASVEPGRRPASRGAHSQPSSRQYVNRGRQRRFAGPGVPAEELRRRPPVGNRSESDHARRCPILIQGNVRHGSRSRHHARRAHSQPSSRQAVNRGRQRRFAGPGAPAEELRRRAPVGIRSESDHARRCRILIQGNVRHESRSRHHARRGPSRRSSRLAVNGGRQRRFAGPGAPAEKLRRRAPVGNRQRVGPCPKMSDLESRQCSSTDEGAATSARRARSRPSSRQAVNLRATEAVRRPRRAGRRTSSPPPVGIRSESDHARTCRILIQGNVRHRPSARPPRSRRGPSRRAGPSLAPAVSSPRPSARAARVLHSAAAHRGGRVGRVDIH